MRFGSCHPNWVWRETPLLLPYSYPNNSRINEVRYRSSDQRGDRQFHTLHPQLHIVCVGIADYALKCLSGVQKSNALDAYALEFESKRSELAARQHDELLQALDRLKP